MSGWLDKLGGAHGGRKSWKRRWFVLLGTSLYYYGSPADAACKKGRPIDFSGGVATLEEGSGTFGFTLSWGDGGQPERLLRASSPDERERWLAALKRAVRIDIARGGKRPVGHMAKMMGGAAASGGAGEDGAGAGGSSGSVADEGVRAARAALEALGPVPVSALAFQLVLGSGGDAAVGIDDDDDGAEGGRAKPAAGSGRSSRDPIVLICPTLRELDLWCSGLLKAIATQRRLTAAQRVERYTRHLERQPADVVTRVCLGEAHEEAGNMQAALTQYEAAAAAQPRLPSARRAAGRLRLLWKADAAAALPHLEAAAALLECEDWEAMGWLGQARLALKLYKPAAAAFTFALGTDMRTSATLTRACTVGLGDCLLELGRKEEALARYKAALKLEPAGAPAIAAAEKLLSLCTLLGRESDAAAYRTELRKLELAEVPALEAAAAAAVAAEDYRNATKALEVVVRAHPEDIERLLACANAFYMLEGQRMMALQAALEAPGAGGDTGGSGGGRSGKASSDVAHAGAGAPAEDGDRDGLLARSDSASGDEDEGGDGGSGSSARAKSRARSTASAASSSSHAPRGSIAVQRSISLSPLLTAKAAAAPPVVSHTPPGCAPLPVDSLDSMALLTRAEELVVRVLELDAESADANLLCGKLYERFAALELAAAEAALLEEGRGCDAASFLWRDPGEEVAASGWTPNQRLQRVEAFYAYIIAAYSDIKSAEAAYLLGTYCKSKGRLEEAAVSVQLAVERATLAKHEPEFIRQAGDMLVRIERLRQGKSEVPSEAELAEAAAAAAAAVAASAGGAGKGKASKPGEGDVAFEGAGGLALSFSSDMTKEQRDAAFFTAMSEEKRKKEEEKKAREEARIAAMTPEEREKWDSEQKESAKHEAKKGKVLKNQLGAYAKSSGAAAILAGKGKKPGGKSARAL